MARIAVELSDKVVLTSDNPRSEDPPAIIEEMRRDPCLRMRGRVFADTDRRRPSAPRGHGRPGDVVLVAGQGPWTYQRSTGSGNPSTMPPC